MKFMHAFIVCFSLLLSSAMQYSTDKAKANAAQTPDNPKSDELKAAPQVEQISTNDQTATIATETTPLSSDDETTKPAVPTTPATLPSITSTAPLQQAPQPKTTTPSTPTKKSDSQAAEKNREVIPSLKKTTPQVLISISIQNNFTKDAQLNSIEFLVANKRTPLIKNNLNIAIPAARKTTGKGIVTAFDITTDTNNIQSFHGIKSMTIDQNKIIFPSIKTGSVLSSPITITQNTQGQWILEK